MPSANAYQLGVRGAGSDFWLMSQQLKRDRDLLVDRARCEGSILLPPRSCFINMAARARRDSNVEWIAQRRGRGSPARTSSAENVSPRSASAMDESNSASSSSERVKLSGDSGARTVTVEPSSSGGPSTTTFPPTTFPVVTRILECYSNHLSNARHGSERHPSLHRPDLHDAERGCAKTRISIGRPNARALSCTTRVHRRTCDVRPKQSLIVSIIG